MSRYVKGQITILEGPEANVQYTLLTSPDQIKRKTNGRLSSSFITCTVLKQENGGVATKCDSSSVIVTYTVGNKEYFLWGSSNNEEKQLNISEFVSYDSIVVNVYPYATPDETEQGSQLSKTEQYTLGTPVCTSTVLFIEDGKEDPNFEVWIGTTTDPNNEPEPLWSDDEDHVGDYYVGTDGRYWEYTEDLTWVLITDQVLINILNRIDSNGSSKFSVQCQSIEDIDTAVNNLFAAQEYKIGDLLKVTVNPVEERPDDDIMLTAELAPDDETEVGPGGEDQELFVGTKMWMCIENKNGSFNWEDWINANDLEKKLEDAGVNVESNSITFTADRMYLKSTSGNTAASINLFKKDQDGKETGGMYLNTSLLKIDGDVDVDGTLIAKSIAGKSLNIEGTGRFTGDVTATQLSIYNNDNVAMQFTTYGKIKDQMSSQQISDFGITDDNTPVIVAYNNGELFLFNMTKLSTTSAPTVVKHEFYNIDPINDYQRYNSGFISMISPSAIYLYETDGVYRTGGQSDSSLVNGYFYVLDDKMSLEYNNLPLVLRVEKTFDNECLLSRYLRLKQINFVDGRIQEDNIKYVHLFANRYGENRVYSIPRISGVKTMQYSDNLYTDSLTNDGHWTKLANPIGYTEFKVAYDAFDRIKLSDFAISDRYLGLKTVEIVNGIAQLTNHDV